MQREEEEKEGLSLSTRNDRRYKLRELPQVSPRRHVYVRAGACQHVRVLSPVRASRRHPPHPPLLPCSRRPFICYRSLELSRTQSPGRDSDTSCIGK